MARLWSGVMVILFPAAYSTTQVIIKISGKVKVASSTPTIYSFGSLIEHTKKRIEGACNV